MEELKRVIIKGVDIPFIDLVLLLVKLALAAIPAMFILYFVFMLFSVLLSSFFDILVRV